MAAAASKKSKSPFKMMTADMVKQYVADLTKKETDESSKDKASSLAGLVAEMKAEEAKAEIKSDSDSKVTELPKAVDPASFTHLNYPKGPMKPLSEVEDNTATGVIEDVKDVKGIENAAHEVKKYKSILLQRLNFQAKFLPRDAKEGIYKRTLQSMNDIEKDDDLIKQVAKGYLRRNAIDEKGNVKIITEMGLAVDPQLCVAAKKYLASGDPVKKDEIVRGVQATTPFNEIFIKGQRCDYCTQPKSEHSKSPDTPCSKCSRCKVANYCSETHQRNHFNIHKPECKALKLSYEKQLACNIPKFGSTVAHLMANNVWTIATSLTCDQIKKWLTSLMAGTVGAASVSSMGVSYISSTGCVPAFFTSKTRLGMIPPLVGLQIKDSSSGVGKFTDPLVGDVGIDQKDSAPVEGTSDKKVATKTAASEIVPNYEAPNETVIEWLATHHAPCSLKILSSDSKLVEICISVKLPGRCRYCVTFSTASDVEAKVTTGTKVKTSKEVFCRGCTMVNCCSACLPKVHTKKSCEATVNFLTIAVNELTYKGNRFAGTSASK
jgi:hypothetical protein